LRPKLDDLKPIIDHQSIIPTTGLLYRRAVYTRLEDDPIPRVIKHPEERQAEILDCAETLFLARGYENASLNEVIAKAGISKGAFYHYFSSKEELLTSLAGRFAQRALAQVQDVFDNIRIDALEQLNEFLDRTWRYKLKMAPANWRMFAALYSFENLHLYYRITNASIELFKPGITRILVKGVQAGTFNTFDPEGVADMLLQLPVSTYPIVAQAVATKSKKGRSDVIAALTKRLRLYGVAIDRLLGLPDGSIRLADAEDVEAVMVLPRVRRS